MTSYQRGKRFGDYEIVDVVGAGGMGKVYKVRNIISERVEAMKVLLPNLASDPDLADRFMREIKVQASLQHPNIAGLHTALRVNNQLLMLIEFVEGVTVEQQLRTGVIPVPKAVDYIRHVLLALGYAHSHGVVHRDIKPANMMLMPNGTVKLMDFGIALLSAERRLTQTGCTVGSLHYMSPEQIQGALDLDARSDLYSVGVSLYEMVTARRPFQGDSDYSIMAAHLGARPVPPVELDPSLPAALNDVILMAIAKQAAHRFQTADAFRMALESVGAGLRAVPYSATRVVSAGASGAPPVAAPPVAGIALGSKAGVAVCAAGSILTGTVLGLLIATGAQVVRTPAAAQERMIASDGLAAPAPCVSLPATQPTVTEPSMSKPRSRKSRPAVPASSRRRAKSDKTFREPNHPAGPSSLPPDPPQPPEMPVVRTAEAPLPPKLIEYNDLLTGLPQRPPIVKNGAGQNRNWLQRVFVPRNKPARTRARH